MFRSPPGRGERGMALVMAMLALVVMSLIVAGLMLSITTGQKVTGHNLRTSQSLYIAEAGVAEATSRLRVGDVPASWNPRMVAKIFNTEPGLVPVLGSDSVALATQQPAGQWLPYSTDARSEQVLTVTYKTDPARTVIYRYDQTKTPPVQTATGSPIFTITSTGRKGNDRTTIIADVMMRPFSLWTRGAMTAEQGIDFSGDCFVCGWNHSANTPVGYDERAECQPYEVGWGWRPGAWSCDTITSAGSSFQEGVPPLATKQVNFYAGPWQALSMSQSDFLSWVGAPVATEPSPPRGIYYLDNDGIPQNRTGSFAFHGGNGEGFLYVDGDLTLNSNFTFLGMIYVEGDLKINGDTWILGSLVVKGKTTVKIANGNAAILYSWDAIQQKLTAYGGQVTTLSWREVH